MRIAQIAPLMESVPPALYGGTERVVSYLTEELVRQGHDVTLFASGDSRTNARLISPCDRSLRLDVLAADRMAYHLLMLEWVFQRHADFDVMHFHLDFMPASLARRQRTPHVHTFHGRLDLPELAPLAEEFDDTPLISVSDSQRAPLPVANWLATVYHGLPDDLYHLDRSPEGYLAFLGRASAEKRLDRAIEIARRCGMELRIAAKVDEQDRKYFESEIRDLLRTPRVRWLGEIGERDKQAFLGNARALLFPIDWPEPFGLVMIEAMACGTPVIAFDCGSVREVVDEGVTGFVVRNVDEAVAAVRQVGGISRGTCRRVFERRFSATQMAAEYVKCYRRLMERKAHRRGTAPCAR